MTPLGLGLGLGLTQAGQGSGPFLSSLFANGEDGFLFGNFIDLARQFLLSTGGANVAANDDPEGLSLDLRGKTLAEVLASQQELLNQNVSNGTVGVIGSGGAFPSGVYLQTAAGGIVREVVGFGSDANGPYVDLKVSGTNSGGVTVFPGLLFGATTSAGSPVVSPSMSYRSSLGLALIAGSITGFSSVAHSFNEYSAAGGYLGTTSIVSPITLTGAYQRLDVIAKPAFGTVGRMQAIVPLGVANGVTVNATFRVWAASLKAVPGNHALQATGTKRPFWKANSGLPRLGFDGSDDALITPFVPTTAVTLAAAVNITATGASQVALGGGTATGNKRCLIGVNTSNRVDVGWGSEAFGNLPNGPIITGADHVILLTGDASSRDLWLDGVLINSRAPSGGTGPDGTGGGIALGAFNNGGSASVFMSGGLSAALALNRRVTPAEIALITSQFRSTYP